MVADSALPVWSIQPNWKNGITETLEWLSDVLRNSYGVEQVRALRLSPRRTFEVGFNPLDQERAFFDLWLHRLGSDEFMLPLWHDRGELTANIVAGATAIPFDTTYREFEVGQLAILAGPDAFTFDKVAIEAITDAGITVTAGGVTLDWPTGAAIHPLRRARLEDQSAAAAITSVVGEATLRFELNQANDLPDEGTWDSTYGDYPVILEEPNRRENLKLTFDLETVLADNEVGLRELTDDAGRAFTMQTHLMMLVGRAEQWAFRQMLYRLRGQQTAVWLPSFNRDLELSRDRVAADALLDFKQIGYAYTGGVIDGRQHLLIDGSTPRQATAVGVAPSSTEERVLLDSALGADFPIGTFASFMDTCRLAQDRIEITHITDTDGVAESSISFRSFRDERTAPDPTEYPIPTAAKGSEACGTPSEETCLGIETGFWGELVVDLTGGPLNALIPSDEGIPHMFPWSWQISLWRAGVQIAGMDSSGGGGTTVYDGPDVDDHCNGWTGHIVGGDDPFADGNPDTIKVEIQFPYNDWAFPEGQALMSIGFKRPSDSLTLGTSTVTTVAGAGYLGTNWARVEGLWPIHYEYSLP